MRNRKKWVQCKRSGKLIPYDEYISPSIQSAYVIDDTMDATVHPCNGKSYNSKSTFRKVTKAHGCVEMGNEYVSPGRHEMGPMGGDVKDAIEHLESGGRVPDSFCPWVDE